MVQISASRVWGKLKRLLITYSPCQTLKRNEDSAVFGRRKRKNIVVNKTGFLKSCESLQPQEVLQHAVMKVPKKYEADGSSNMQKKLQTNARMHMSKAHNLPEASAW